MACGLFGSKKSELHYYTIQDNLFEKFPNILYIKLHYGMGK